MDTLRDLFAGRVPEQPPEIAIIKQYVQTQFKHEVGVAVRDKDIVILASSAVLANALRLRLPALQRLCNTDKRITIRVGQTPRS